MCARCRFAGELPKLPKRQQEVWNIIEERRELPLQELLELAETTAATVRRLEDRGWSRSRRKFPSATPTRASTSCPRQPLALNRANRRSALEENRCAQ